MALMRRVRRTAARDGAWLTGLLAVLVLVNHPQHRAGMLWWVATGLAVAGVALRRRWPVPMLVVCTLSVSAHLAQDAPLTVIDVSMAVLLYTVAVRRARAVSLTALAGLLLALTGWSAYYTLHGRPVPGLPVLAFRAGGGFGPATGHGTVTVDGRGARSDPWSGPYVLGSALVATWAVGSGARSRREYLDQLHARAQDLERERDQRAALAVAAERGRLSRELHDVVAHGLSMIVIQAQGGAAALDSQPADTRAALAAIVRVGRDSLADMRRVLDAMGDVDDAWQPQPGLGHLPALLDQVRDTGTQVRLQVDGFPVTLPATVDLSAYRIVQEALTNVMKHAGTGATAQVVVSYRDAAIGIEVSDDGRGMTDNGGNNGNGLRGMRERVRLLGGQFTAGPALAGGFAVRANLPVAAPRS